MTAAATAGGSIAVWSCPSCSYFSQKARPATSTLSLVINPVNQRRTVICLAAQESSTSTVEPVEVKKEKAAAEETKVEGAAKPKPAAKAPVKPLPQLMEEDVIPSLTETLQAQQDLSDLQLSFDATKV